MQIRQVLAIAVLFLPLCGCFSTGGKYLLYSPEKKVPGVEYNDNIRKHIGSLEQGPMVEGNDCESAVIGLIPLPPSFHIIPDLDKAYADAMEKAGGKYDALIKAEVTFTQYIWTFPIRIICYDIKGTAVKDVPYVTSEYRPK